jgi:hypothetical protein
MKSFMSIVIGIVIGLKKMAILLAGYLVSSCQPAHVWQSALSGPAL